ncbi:HAMP domain-containing histidine kinase [Chroococcidiopsis sp. FACHB-1243]|uniref:sensor histidine kinase n=1 Tax=Chroococcidiopsis sp. [FACHB-1243] TaxID=2692781 RepID=UPI00177E5C87|nr:HAMP domain-containing sensor histidine kinase [Chroococcidiopsis sp. [FACHB-1243]]MBD2308743.1 HAMP domain-containing histidine kinase [Chroococcidiopsis sp. [FACHB-1243]]
MADKTLSLNRRLKLVSGSNPLNLKGRSSTDNSQKLRDFLQFQLEQLTAQSAIAWAQIIYIDPLSGARRQVVAAETLLPFSPDLLSDLRSETWLVEFPPAFSLLQIVGDRLENTVVYFCPYGYQQQQCQYLLIVAKDILSLSWQQYIQQTAVLVSEYLERHLESLQQQHQIKILEQIIQRVGHQLRQPLSLIGLYAENLYRSLTRGTLQDRAAIIRETTQDLDRNLTELIYCSDSETLRFTLQDLQGLVVESLQGFQAWIAEKQIQIRYPDTSVVLSLDRLQMKQVFDNLLSNAIHFSPIGSTIAIGWQVFHSEVLISIADEGTGLSPTDLQYLFTPFYSRRSGGTGLGLAIAQKVVLAHQGNLWAKNLPVKGAEFSLILPRSLTST